MAEGTVSCGSWFMVGLAWASVWPGFLEPGKGLIEDGVLWHWEATGRTGTGRMFDDKLNEGEDVWRLGLLGLLN